MELTAAQIVGSVIALTSVIGALWKTLQAVYAAGQAQTEAHIDSLKNERAEAHYEKRELITKLEHKHDQFLRALPYVPLEKVSEVLGTAPNSRPGA